MPAMHGSADPALVRERHRLLTRVSRAMLTPMIVLSFVWLALTVVSLTRGLSPFFASLSYVIWGLFGVQFLVELAIAPRKVRYLRRQWITAVALLLPAIRLFSVFRLARVVSAARGARLVRALGSVNRGMRALGRVMDRRGVGYVLLLTIIVALAGAAAVYALERNVPGSRIDSFGTAFWWAAMTLTTMGTDFFPLTGEGRVLALALAIYGFAVFGYLTATVASYFVARDADESEGELAGARQVDSLREELAGVRHQLEALGDALRRDARP